MFKGEGLSIRLLVINLGWEQAPLIDYLSAQGGLELYGVHYNAKSYRPKVFKEILTTNLRDLGCITEFADKVRPEAVIADQCDYSLFVQAMLAQRYGLPGPSLESAQFSNNKFLQRLRSREEGLTIPEFELCWTPVQVRVFAEQHGLPVIIKPVDNRGSFGVVKINDVADIDAAFQQSLVHSHSRTLLVETFIHGVHITVDGYAFPKSGIKSLALATKVLDGPDSSVAVEIVYPGRLPEAMFRRALAVNEAVNHSLGYRFGMTHSEYMISNEEVYLIESANRGGGVFTSALIVPASSGVDLVRQYVADCLGENIDLYQLPKHQSVVLRFFSFKSGRVQTIEGWESICADPRLLAQDLFVSTGDVIQPITNDANRHGYIILRGTSEEANSLLQKVKVTYEG
ncbi:MAG: Phosphoribosylglycinamide formyltransferase 2 [Nitrosomonadaceae bacterium]|nr:Phosphoribosylglycinamide formyltransferase 2 [Nitrosomonadaceae bacterium]